VLLYTSTTNFQTYRLLFFYDNVNKIIVRVQSCITAGMSISEKVSLLMQIADAQFAAKSIDQFTGSHAFRANPDVALSDLR